MAKIGMAKYSDRIWLNISSSILQHQEFCHLAETSLKIAFSQIQTDLEVEVAPSAIVHDLEKLKTLKPIVCQSL